MHYSTTPEVKWAAGMAVFGAARNMKVYLHTFGCQMNFLEAQLLQSVLSRAGMSVVTQPLGADVAVVNGCLVREHAEIRALQKVAALRAQGVPIVGVIGCLARREGGVGAADFVVSPEHYDRLPEVIARAGQDRAALVGYEGEGLGGALPRVGPTVAAWVAVSRGCDNFCSYCVVPYARGREVSRSPEDIVVEVESLAGAGCKEVVLIGQNVNSYRWGSLDFPGLLELVDRLSLVPRIRFLTSHPRDMGLRTLEVMAASRTICHYLHLPLQAGSDRVLARMNRGYTAEEYRSLVRLARELMPHVGITTDLMVGFPGESDTDFSRTLALVGEIEFDGAFTFGYSRRPGTAAGIMADPLSQRLVAMRLQTLVPAVRESAERRVARRVGSPAEVLVEGESPKSGAECIGRSREGNVTVLPRDRWSPGDIVQVEIRESRAFTLVGMPVPEQRPGCGGATGGRANRPPAADKDNRTVEGVPTCGSSGCLCSAHRGGMT